MILTNAVPPFDGDEIFIQDPKSIVDVTVDHTLANGDCTRVVLSNWEVFRVKESVDEVQHMIENNEAMKSTKERIRHWSR